jgi:hypothetical protein
MTLMGDKLREALREQRAKQYIKECADKKRKQAEQKPQPKESKS